MEVSELPPEEVSKFREKAKPVADKYAAGGRPGADAAARPVEELRGKN